MIEAMVKKGRDLDKDRNLEVMVKVAVKLLRNLNLKVEVEEGVVEELDKSLVASMSRKHRAMPLY